MEAGKYKRNYCCICKITHNTTKGFKNNVCEKCRKVKIIIPPPDVEMMTLNSNSLNTNVKPQLISLELKSQNKDILPPFFDIAQNIINDDLLNMNSEKTTNNDSKNISIKTKRDVWLKYIGQSYEGSCYVCGNTVNNFDFEAAHFISRARGGDNSVENLRVTCRKCNNDCGKTNLGVYALEKKKSSITDIIKEIKQGAREYRHRHFISTSTNFTNTYLREKIEEIIDEILLSSDYKDNWIYLFDQKKLVNATLNSAGKLLFD